MRAAPTGLYTLLIRMRHRWYKEKIKIRYQDVVGSRDYLHGYSDGWKAAFDFVKEYRQEIEPHGGHI